MDTKPNPLPPLRYGDILLYSHKGFFDTLIRLKTWSRITHIEVVYEVDPVGACLTTYASRNGKGVAIYSFDDTVFEVPRPKDRIDQDAADQWFKTVQGTKYGWLTLADFAGIPVPASYK